MLPKLTPATERGQAGVAAYARYEGIDVATFLERFGPTLTLDQVGKNILDLVVDPAYDKNSYALTSAGLNPIS